MAPVWNRKGKDAAQLFRDFYFEKYTPGTPSSTVHEDRDRPYRFYNKNSFYRHVKKVKEQVDTYKQFKTGLGDAAFKKFLRLDEEPTDEERASKVVKNGSKKAKSVVEEESEDEEDDSTSEGSTYNPHEDDEEDIPLGRGFDIESLLEQMSITAPRSHGRSTMSGPKNNIIGEKYLATCPDGKLAGVIKLPSGFDGNISTSDDCRKVVIKTFIPRVLTDAEKCFSKLGIPKTNVFVVHLQSAMNSVVQDAKTGENARLYNEVDIFHLPFKVRPTFTNNEGFEDHVVQIGTYNGVEWAFFFLEDANIVKKLRSPEARMVRDRTRSRLTVETGKKGKSGSPKKMKLGSEGFYTPREHENPKGLTPIHDEQEYEEEEVTTDGEMDEYN